jgi:hypothetical protein
MEIVHWRRSTTLPTLAAILASLIITSCGRKGLVLVALDEAFAAVRPGLARELSGGPGAAYRSVYLQPRLSERPGAILGEIEAAKAKGENPIALVASPLLAAALPGPWRRGGLEESSLGGLLMLLPEPRIAESPPSSSLARSVAFAEAVTDPVPAYAAAGRAAGGFIASIAAQEGGVPACGLIYLEAPSRPRRALQAFAESFAAASGSGSPLVRELPPSDDAENQAEAAVRELFSADIRVLFIALGGGGPAAIRAAAKPGLVVGADYPGPEPPANLTFRVRPDESALAAALWAALPGARSAPAGKMPRTAVPALVEIMNVGGDSTKRAFASFLRAARAAESAP